MKKLLLTCILAGGVIALAPLKPAHAQFVINPTFDASVAANFGVNTVPFEKAFMAAASEFTANFDDNIQINFTVKGVAGTSTFGGSNTQLLSLPYANLYNAVVADAKTADDNTAIGPGGSVSATDPTPRSTWDVARAQAKALGLIPSDSLLDGTLSFGAGFAWSFDPMNRAVAGKYDIIGVMEHEISESMGRLGISGRGFNTSSLIDSFSFTGPGARGLTNGPNNQFSINDGTTLLKTFNNAAANGLDTRDWAPGTNDAFNQFSNSGVINVLSTVDLREMDVIGWDRAGVVPEPDTYAMLFAGLGLLGFAARRRKV